MTSRGRHPLVAVLTGVVTVAAYASSLHAGFVWDDNFQIVRNPYLHTDQPLSKLFFSDVWSYLGAGHAGMSNYYRPLQLLTYRLTMDLAGLHPLAFHAVSLAFAWLTAIAAYLVFWRLTRRFGVALAAAMLFAAHPIHSEAIFWVAALTELGCALFYFLAFWLYLLSTEPVASAKAKSKASRRAKPEAARDTRTRWLTAAACAGLLLALLWKEMALTLPLIVAAHAAFFPRSSDRTRWRAAFWRSLPFWATTAVYCVLRVVALGYFSKVQHRWTLSGMQFVANVIRLAGEYIVRLCWPFPLKVFHVFHPSLSAADPKVLLAALLLLGAAYAIYRAARPAPLAAFCATWTLVTIVPVLNIQGVGENVFAERYLYIPSLGFCLLMAWAWDAVLSQALTSRARKVISMAAVAVVVLACVVAVRARSADWHDDRSLYSTAVRQSPNASQMRNGLAQTLLDAGDIDGASREFESARDTALSQNNAVQAADAYMGLSGIAFRRGELTRALDLTERGLAVDGSFAPLHVSEGIILLQMGRVDEAEAKLREANRYFPNDEVVLNALGVVAMSRKDYAEATRYFEQAVRVVPSFADGYNNLGQVKLETGAPQDAVSYFQRAVELQPANPKFVTNLGAAFANSGRFDEARVEFQRALQLSPGYAAAANNLARLNQATAARR